MGGATYPTREFIDAGLFIVRESPATRLLLRSGDVRVCSPPSVCRPVYLCEHGMFANPSWAPGGQRSGWFELELDAGVQADGGSPLVDVYGSLRITVTNQQTDLCL